MQDIYPPTAQNNTNQNNSNMKTSSSTSISLQNNQTPNTDNSKQNNLSSSNLSSLNINDQNNTKPTSIQNNSLQDNTQISSNSSSKNDQQSRSASYAGITNPINNNSPYPLQSRKQNFNPYRPSSSTTNSQNSNAGNSYNQNTDTMYDDPFAQWDNNNDDFGSGWGSSNNFGRSNQKSTTRLSPEERVQMIERLYEEILGRKAETKDINYYKFSTLNEDEIRKQLLTGKEHKELLANGNEYKSLKERCDEAENQVRLLEAQIKDQIIEFQKLAELLKSKNRYIQELRKEANNPYNIPEETVRSASQYNRLSQQAYYGKNITSDNKSDESANQSDKDKNKKSYSILDRIGSILSD